MLILSRRKGDAIVIDDNVRIVVLGIDGRGVVRLGVEAPADVRILRGEIVSQVEDENQRAKAGNKAWLEVVPIRRPA